MCLNNSGYLLLSMGPTRISRSLPERKAAASSLKYWFTSMLSFGIYIPFLEESRLLATADATADLLLMADPNMSSICEPLAPFDVGGL